MNTVSQFSADEPPTKREEHTPTRLLTFASRIDRLCALALERLFVAPDEHAIEAAIADLTEARALAATVR